MQCSALDLFNTWFGEVNFGKKNEKQKTISANFRKTAMNIYNDWMNERVKIFEIKKKWDFIEHILTRLFT